MLSFEDQIDIIDKVIAKRRNKWQLRDIAEIDYEDVSQILKFHIYKKWNLWDQNRPLAQWLNRIITNQIKNLIRNIYGKLAPPCKDCPFNTKIGDSCLFTESGVKCGECSLYRKWEKNKKNGYNLLLAESIDSPDFDNSNACFESVTFDIDDATKRFHDEMKKHLPSKLFLAYKLIYILGLSDEEAAKALGFKTNETGRKPGYKQILNMKSALLKIAKERVYEMDVIYNID